MTSSEASTEELPLVVVLPVYHEEGSIEATLEGLATQVPRAERVLVVYDGDDDPTLPVVRGLLPAHPRVRLVKNDLGKGVLNAIKTGFRVAIEEVAGPDGDAAVVVVMADLSDDLGAVEAMYRLLVAGYDLVAGSRYMPGGAQHGGGVVKPRLSRLAGRSLHRLTSLPTHDVTNAFRMYRASFLRQVEVESTGGFELSTELTVKAWANGFRVGEVPSVWTDRAAGESKFRLFAWLPKYLRWYGAALAHEYLGRPVGRGPA